MHSYLFVGTNTEKLFQEIQAVSRKEQGRLIEFDCKTIEQVRDLKHFVSLSTREKQFIYLPSVHLASEAAQNALLKTLEEPQENITFLLTAEVEDKVLPTVRSRCEIIRIQHTVSADALNKFREFMQKSGGEKLKLISEINKREDAEAFLKAIIEGGSMLLKDNPNTYRIVENAQTALERIEGNANVQIQLTNFVVQHLSEEQA
jgi:DNA polymerase III delta prime subunit